MRPTRGRRLHKMGLNAISLICCVLLSIRGNAEDSEDFSCKENVPAAIQGSILDAINAMRTRLTLNGVEYETNCDLGKEAFTGVLGGSSSHHGFNMESAFDGTWKKTLENIIEKKQSQISNPEYEKVGCGIKLDTFENGAHNLYLKCAFKKRHTGPR